MSAKIYRPDIDGLRAIAVSAVILFHLNLPGFSGGFLGVDIFFVISGFLIGQLLLADQQAHGRISPLRFYMRRFRRIVPALLFTILLSCLLAYGMLLPDDMLQFTASLLPGALFYANYHFLAASQDYFNAQANIMPLLHLWSLGVEGQFYLMVPLLMLFIMHQRRPSLKAIFFILVLSLTVATRYADYAPQQGFFGFIPRVWQPLLGMWVACLPPMISTNHVRTGLLAALALLVIIFYLSFATTLSWLLLGSRDVLGVFAAPLCGAVAVLLYVGRSHMTAAHRLLASRPLVGVGLISYSLYLLHWPLLKYFEYMLKRDLHVYETIIYLCICSILAIISWRLIETPLRSRNVPFKRIAALAGAVVLNIAVFVYASYRSDGFRSQAMSRMLPSDTYERQVSRLGSCFTNDRKEFDAHRNQCLLTQRPNMLLFGDSHAAHLYYGLKQRYQDKIAISQFTGPSCAPIDNVQKSYCNEVRPIIMQQLAAGAFDIVVISADWFERKEMTLTEMMDRLERTLAAIPSSTRVVIVGPSMVFEQPPSAIAVKQREFQEKLYRLLYGPQAIPVRTRRELPETEKAMRARFAGRYPYASVYSHFCPGGQCRYENDSGDMLVWDDEHFTFAGSASVANEAIAPLLDPLVEAAVK